MAVSLKPTTRSNTMAVLKVGLGHATTAAEAVAGAMRNTPRPELALVFCAYGCDPQQVYAEVRRAVGEKAAIIGGSTAGEFSSAMPMPQNDSVVVMTLQSSYLSVGVGVGENLSGDPQGCARAAVAGAHRTLPSNPTVMSLMLLALDSKKTADASRLKPFVNLILPDGCTGQEEAFIRHLIEEASNVARIVGGSTANNFSSTDSFQFGNGVHRNSGVVATLSSGLKIGTAMGHPYYPAEVGAVATRTSGRIVHEFDGRPAAEVVKSLYGVPELSAELFAQKPFGLKSSDVFGEYTIKSIMSAQPDGSVTFYAEVPEGVYLRLMKTDRQYAINSYRSTLQRAIADAGSPKKIGAIIVFNCILRHLLKCRIDIDDLAIVREVAGDTPMIGFNTFGEQGNTLGGAIGHYNQTATVLVLGDELISQ
jgi:hypothetical protein